MKANGRIIGSRVGDKQRTLSKAKSTLFGVE
jgi:hypothetical protein